MDNRYDQLFRVVQIPQVFTPEDRGGDECCERFQVLADPEDNATWKNDITLAYIIAETATFILKKEGVVTGYIPVTLEFPNDADALYTQIDWQAVFISDGPGCYTLEVQSNVAGIDFLLPKGEFRLDQYSVFETRGSVRLKTVFNDNNEKLGIDFTGSNAVDTVRMHGEITDFQPKTKIENIQLTTNVMIKTTREYLYQYTLETLPITEYFGERLLLNLLGENQCFLSDHNATAYSKKWLDLPIIVDQDGGGPETPLLPGSRFIKLKCIFGDKTRIEKTNY